MRRWRCRADQAEPRTRGSRGRSRWLIENSKDFAKRISFVARSKEEEGRVLLAIPTRERLERVLRRVLDEEEFLLPFGVRSVSRAHRDRPFVCNVGGRELRVGYEPAEGRTSLFGGNSNWRGPIWLPMNYLLVEALERYHRSYGDDLMVAMPTGIGRRMNLLDVSQEISRRLSSLFLRGADGKRPCHLAPPGGLSTDQADERVLFHEYFDGDTGRGLGASHQTGWMSLVVRLLERRAAVADEA